MNLLQKEPHCDECSLNYSLVKKRLFRIFKMNHALLLMNIRAGLGVFKEFLIEWFLMLTVNDMKVA